MRTSAIFAAVAATSVAAINQGFNYGSTFTTGAAKQVADFTAEFNAAKALAGTNGAFTSARLYTCVQAGTSNSYISAFQAAIDTDTTLLLGLWGSGGQTAFSNEIVALQSAISALGTSFTSRVVGISVGSEDLYRISPTGIAAMSGYGANPDVLVSYISQLRSAIAGTALAKVPVGHVDTWTAWVNGSNSAVVTAVDFLGTDAYPYFQSTQANSISNGASLFQAAYQATVAVSAGKPVWITETGWPVSGATAGDAVPSPANAKTYWDAVGCPNFGVVNTYWYTLDDALPTTPNPSFGVIATLTSSPIFDLSCSAAVASSSAAPVASSSTAAVASSAASSVVSNLATSSALVSSGGGLTPSQGAGNGIGASQLSLLTQSASTTAAVSQASSASSASSVAGVAPTTSSKSAAASGTSTTVVSTLSSSKTATATSGSATSSYTGAAASLVVNALGGLAVAAVAALAAF